LDPIRAAIAAGVPTFGTWLSLADPVAAELIGKAGFDWVIADAQHGGITFDKLLTVLQALDLGGTPALVRVGWVDPPQIMRALDLGALGVVVPMVSTAEQARAAAEACRYPPDGNRSFGPVRASHLSAGGGGPDPLCLVMIETAEGIANVDAIAATPGVDGLFVGPVDLALALGLGPAFEMPDRVFEAIDEVVAACRRHGKISGCAALGPSNAKALMARGVHFLPLMSDAGLLRTAAATQVAQTKEWLREFEPANEDRD
jgi:4-hydroxy-2-oxoheptanedioate aldolase